MKRYVVITALAAAAVLALGFREPMTVALSPHAHGFPPTYLPNGDLNPDAAPPA